MDSWFNSANEYIKRHNMQNMNEPNFNDLVPSAKVPAPSSTMHDASGPSFDERTLPAKVVAPKPTYREVPNFSENPISSPPDFESPLLTPRVGSVPPPMTSRPTATDLPMTSIYGSMPKLGIYPRYTGPDMQIAPKKNKETQNPLLFSRNMVSIDPRHAPSPQSDLEAWKQKGQ